MRTSLACHFAPLLLRIALGLIFLWAGVSKVFYVDSFSGAAAAGLANAGVQAAIDAAAPTTAPPILPAPDADAPAGTDDSADGSVSRRNASRATILAASAQAAAPAYTAEQFPAERSVKLRRLHGLILAMAGAESRGQWPPFLATPQAYQAMAWAAALTELFAGIFLLVGFLSRFAALGVVGVMAGALWMTQIGPNLGADGALLGFLPDPKLDDAAAWSAAWKDLLFQFVLVMAGLSLFFSGPGKVSVDGFLFTGSRASRRDEDDDE
jgi:uncharacterized membrane protein YphA (DoxX/SURF4 family)